MTTRYVIMISRAAQITERVISIQRQLKIMELVYMLVAPIKTGAQLTMILRQRLLVIVIIPVTTAASMMTMMMTMMITVMMITVVKPRAAQSRMHVITIQRQLWMMVVVIFQTVSGPVAAAPCLTCDQQVFKMAFMEKIYQSILVTTLVDLIQFVQPETQDKKE
ncbi:MAG: hypothetical protein CME98_10120 [Hyphomonas sp.]|nr:hypothetical protein [Hyphomonas sp.]